MGLSEATVGHAYRFDRVTDGYDPQQVDRYVNQLAVTPRAQQQLADYRAQVLSRAEKEAREMLEAARYLREIASQEVDALAADVRTQAEEEASRILESARAEAHRIRTTARREADEARQAARTKPPRSNEPPVVAARPRQAELQLIIDEVQMAVSDAPVAFARHELSVEDMVLNSLMRRRTAPLPRFDSEGNSLLASA